MMILLLLPLALASPDLFRDPAEIEAATGLCVSCHLTTDSANMHTNPAVPLGCADCHGGDPTAASERGAHVRPRFAPSGSANPERSYTLLNREDPDWVRFINPGDYRVARETCGGCHLPIVQAAERSLMATGSMFWGAAAYNNGIVPMKRSILGEAYTSEGIAATIANAVPVDGAMRARGIAPILYPLPDFAALPPADVFRVYEDGGRFAGTHYPETGLPGGGRATPTPGRPDLQASNRGPGTGNRTAGPVQNLHKTRLNDPMMWFLGTNDQPGDYRSSGCSACHVVYANDADPAHSGPYAAFGHRGTTATSDPTIPRDESGHPLRHSFSRAIPTSQCMSCHMHQPNIFVNSFLGYTMWDYESDAPLMWPEEAQKLGMAERRRVLDRNPEGAVVRGKWADPAFLDSVADLEGEDTRFADYHGHGWNFRAVFKKDRRGNLLDAAGEVVPRDDPDRFDKAVHMSSIHLDAGMHCVDCHFGQDAHGSGHLHVEVPAAIEIRCRDCHGTVDAYPALTTSGPAAPPGGTELDAQLTPDGRRR